MASDMDLLLKKQRLVGSRALVWLVLFTLAGLITWAYFAWIDEVVRGEGKVVPSRQVQIVQSLDGGVVESLLVRAGQSVEEGEVLLRTCDLPTIKRLDVNSQCLQTTHGHFRQTPQNPEVSSIAGNSCEKQKLHAL